MIHDEQPQRTWPIAVFDSGVGGLSVLRHLNALLPHESFLYLADQAHVPYGARSGAEVRQLSQAITAYLLAQGARMVVVACNTASAAALNYLRQAFPHVPFVGMEPAVKPAARQTRSGKVGVLATNGTFSSERYAALMARFAQNVSVIEDPCVGLVELIEAGATDDPRAEAVLRRCLRPMLAAGVDTLVLGCTHYPFVRPLIEAIAGPHVTIIDPAPAVARQARRVWEQRPAPAEQQPAARPATLRLVTTGDAAQMSALARRLVGYEGDVETAVWRAAPSPMLHPALS